MQLAARGARPGFHHSLGARHVNEYALRAAGHSIPVALEAHIFLTNPPVQAKICKRSKYREQG